MNGPVSESFWLEREAEKERLRSVYIGRRDRMRRRYEESRMEILAERRIERAQRRKEEANAGPTATGADIERLPDPAARIERERTDSMESVRLRLLWAVAAGGDEGLCAKCAIAVIRFAEGDGRHWSDRGLKSLHIRMCLSAGMTEHRFKTARAALVRELFIPL